jgi:hypothetical protein
VLILWMMLLVSIVNQRLFTRTIIALCVTTIAYIVFGNNRLDLRHAFDIQFVLCVPIYLYCIYTELTDLVTLLMGTKANLQLELLAIIYCFVYLFGTIIVWRMFQLSQLRKIVIEEVVRTAVLLFEQP